MSAPIFSASARRRRIVGGDDRVLPLQSQRRDHGEPDRAAADHQRHLVAAHIGFGDAWTPTASGSVNAACSAASPFGTSSSNASLSSMRSA